MPTTTETDRYCALGIRCGDPGPDNQPALLHPGAPPLCDRDLYTAERDIAALPADYVALEQLVPKSLGEWSPDGQPARRGRGEHPLPLREYVLVVQRTIWWLLTAWEPVVRELDRLSPERRTGVREGWAVQAAAQVIAPRTAKLTRVGPTDMADYPDVDNELVHAIVWGNTTSIDHTRPTGLEGVLHLQRLHDMARSVTGLSERVRRLPGTCDKCDTEGGLWQHHPIQYRHDPPVWCAECGAWQPYDTYERQMRLILGGRR